MRVLVIVLMVGAVRIAAAQPVDPAVRARADAAYAEGSTAYNADDFAKAAQKFEEAYSLIPDPAYLFNIGQAYRQQKDCVKAADAFKKFVALAPDAPNIGNAKDLLKEVNMCAIFVEGRRLMGAGRPAEACEKFGEAYKADPDAVGTLLNLGLCNEQIGKLATAAEWFRKAEKKGAEVNLPEAVDQAKQHLEGISTKIPKLDIVIDPANPKAVVKLDGKTITTLKAVEVDPGRHTVDVEAPKMAPATKTVELALEGKQTARLSLLPLGTGGTPSNRLAYILGGAGLTLWVGTAVLGFVGKAQYDDAQTFAEQDKWKTRVRYGGTAMFVIGTAAISTSVWLYIRNRGRRSESAESAHVTPAVGTNQIGLSVVGSF
jgi:tetratricopeptide (TPR) repeat protein